MKKYILLSVIFSLFMSTIVLGQLEKRQKIGQTGMKFLSVSPDASVSALGSAATSLGLGSASVFYNPAGMTFLNSFANISLGRVNWIADIDYIYGSAVFNPSDGLYGVFGINFISVDYGSFKGTIRDVGEQGFIDTGNYSPTASAIGLSYARALSTQFSVGANIKYVLQDLGSSFIQFTSSSDNIQNDYKKNVFAFDFGVLYRTGFRSLNFGMTIRNFSQEVTYEDEGFQLPLTFKIGVSMNLFDFYEALNQETHSVLLTVDAVHPRDYPEQLNFGLEYLFLKRFALRGGYSTPNDEHDFSAGLGFRQSYRDYALALDYAYTPFGIFDNVHRFTMQFSF
jgi:hypothetical protein